MTGLHATPYQGAREPAFLYPTGGKLFAAVPHRGQQGSEILVYEAK